MTRNVVRAVRRVALGVTLGVGLAYAAVLVLCSPRARAT
jgi:small basic protein